METEDGTLCDFATDDIIDFDDSISKSVANSLFKVPEEPIFSKTSDDLLLEAIDFSANDISDIVSLVPGDNMVEEEDEEDTEEEDDDDDNYYSDDSDDSMRATGNLDLDLEDITKMVKQLRADTNNRDANGHFKGTGDLYNYSLTKSGIQDEMRLKAIESKKKLVKGDFNKEIKGKIPMWRYDHNHKELVTGNNEAIGRDSVGFFLSKLKGIDMPKERSPSPVKESVKSRPAEAPAAPVKRMRPQEDAITALIGKYRNISDLRRQPAAKKPDAVPTRVTVNQAAATSKRRPLQKSTAVMPKENLHKHQVAKPPVKKKPDQFIVEPSAIVKTIKPALHLNVRSSEGVFEAPVEDLESPEAMTISEVVETIEIVDISDDFSLNTFGTVRRQHLVPPAQLEELSTTELPPYRPVVTSGDLQKQPTVVTESPVQQYNTSVAAAEPLTETASAPVPVKAAMNDTQKLQRVQQILDKSAYQFEVLCERQKEFDLKLADKQREREVLINAMDA